MAGRRRDYTEEQLEFLRTQRPVMTFRDLTSAFNESYGLDKSYGAIKDVCDYYGIKYGRLLEYTAERIDFLRMHAKNMAYSSLTKLFNETFGTNKSAGSIRVICSHCGIKTGRPRLNTAVPVGTESVRANGYVMVKTAEKESNGLSVWRYKHILVWETAYGPLPKGCRILFTDGDRRNFSLNNLVKVTRREALYLNYYSLRFPDAEITKAAIGIAKLGVSIWDKEHAQKRKASASTR